MDIEAKVERMSSGEVIAWADLIGVECDTESWLVGEYPERLVALRVAVTDKLSKVLTLFYKEIGVGDLPTKLKGG